MALVLIRLVEELLPTDDSASKLQGHEDATSDYLIFGVVLNMIQRCCQIPPDDNHERDLGEAVDVDEPGALRFPVLLHHVQEQAEDKQLEAA